MSILFISLISTLSGLTAIVMGITVFCIKIRLSEHNFQHQQDLLFEINNLPFTYSMNKLENLSKYSEEIAANYLTWKTNYEKFLKFEKETIEKEILDVKKLADTKKYFRFFLGLKSLSVQVANYEKISLELFSDIENLTNEELKLRIESAELKKYYLSLKQETDKNYLGFDKVRDKIEGMEKNINTLLDRFEEFLQIGNYEQAKYVLRTTADGLKVYAKVVQKIPKIFLIIGRIIPCSIKRIENNLAELRKETSFLDGTRFNFLKISTERAINQLNEYACDLQYIKASKLVAKALQDINNFEAILNKQLKAKEMLNDMFLVFEKAFIDMRETQQNLNKNIYMHQKSVQLSQTTVQLMTISAKKWNEIERMYELTVSELNKDKITRDPIEILESIYYISKKMLEEANNIRRKADVVAQLKDKNIYLEELKKYKNSIATIKLNSHLTNVRYALQEAAISVEVLSEITNAIDTQLKKPRLDEEKVDNLFFDLKNHINRINLISKEKEWNSEKIEELLSIANRYRRVKPDYEIKLSQAESWISNNNHDKARELIEHVLNSVDQNILRKFNGNV
ncbi:MAG: septation ring formation regulator EzrA [Mycoplasma sp.]